MNARKQERAELSDLDLAAVVGGGNPPPKGSLEWMLRQERLERQAQSMTAQSLATGQALRQVRQAQGLPF